ncbi:MAG: DsbA family oxidoreductase [Candidatus Nanopelagicales bacterium]|jgi:predicted DsbA family dithiol-disulfide isomerase|nr:DsbA family oxidoreductase [Candidatus Nanopelagicales bacterium]
MRNEGAHVSPIRVDIWSDVACPWCYIGKRRFEEGVRGFTASHPDVEVQVTYRSFELAPDQPLEVTSTVVAYLSERKGIPRPQVEQMLERVTGLAAAEGLSYDFDAVQQTRTLKAHELLHLARAHGVQDAMKERLLAAYFEQGRHVGRIDELAVLAADVGLDPAEVVDALGSGRYAADVQADIAQARAYGISGVPFFVLDDRYGISGAQPAEAFAAALARAAADRATADGPTTVRA